MAAQQQRGKASRQRRRAVSAQQSYNRVQNAGSKAYRASRVVGFNADLGRLSVAYNGGTVALRSVGQSAIGNTFPSGNGQALGVIS